MVAAFLLIVIRWILSAHLHAMDVGYTASAPSLNMRSCPKFALDALSLVVCLWVTSPTQHIQYRLRDFDVLYRHTGKVADCNVAWISPTMSF
jgi:hypothetical protein